MSDSSDPQQQQQQQQQLPPLYVAEQATTTHTGHGSVGAVIAVLAVITVLGVIAGMIGRLCSGRRIMGYGEYDVEGWMERKCASCIDGRIDAHPIRRQDNNVVNSSGGSVPVAAPVETVETVEMIVEEMRKQSNTDQSTAQNPDQSTARNPDVTRDS
ncbi:hypothetical protein Sjap_017094 [Stephania japonica]|uniref:Transmembrane protein n=1 Tax=Stephania japonica TaxID=461633 RepID=A0AAP0I5H8_9MAGN